jgi:hypothetical protein
MTMNQKPNGGNLSFFIQRVDNTSVTPCAFTFNATDVRLPLDTTPLAWHMFMGRSNATAGTTGVTMGMNKVYISTDN